MEREDSSMLLNQVWHALEKVLASCYRESPAARGLVTAVSTDGVVVRVLLRLSADPVRRGGLLARIENALGGLPSLTGVALRVKPYRSALPAHVAEWAHEACATGAMARLRGEGWVLDGAERSSSSPDQEEPETYRVIVQAEIVRSRQRELAEPLAVH